jgi:hypothetical protein
VAIPDVILIRRESAYGTSKIGRYDGGLFFAWITGAFSPDDSIWGGAVNRVTLLRRHWRRVASRCCPSWLGGPE